MSTAVELKISTSFSFGYFGNNPIKRNFYQSLNRMKPLFKRGKAT